MKFRNKPVVIDAIKYDGTEKSFNECLEFLADGKGNFKRAHVTPTKPNPR